MRRLKRPLKRPDIRRNRVRTALLLASAGSLYALACGMDLPLEERIASIRPLAVRVEVDDPSADPQDPVRTEALPFERVRMVPFIVDIEGPLELETVAADLEPRWFACNLDAIEGLGGCLLSTRPLDLDDVPECPVQTPADLGAEGLPSFPSPCEITQGTPGQPEFTVPLDIAYLLGGDTEVTMVAHTSENVGTNACARRLFSDETQLDDGCIYATHRVAVGPDAVLLSQAIEIGLVDADDVPLPDTLPEPDTHPGIQSFVVRELDEDGDEIAVFQPSRGEVLSVTAGHELVMETIAPESDLQPFLIQQNLDEFAEDEEAFDGRWFTTWGSLLSPTSDDPISVNTWTLEAGPQDERADTPPGERATLFYVLRDGRQGVDWWWFHVDVTAG